MLLLLAACNPEKPTNWIPDYNAKATRPYGFSLFSEAMPKLFPQAKVNLLSVSNKAFENTYADTRNAYVILADQIDYSEQELWMMERWLLDGNDVVLIANDFGKDLRKFLYLDQSKYWGRTDLDGSYGQLTDTLGRNTTVRSYRGFADAQRTYESNAYLIPVYSGGFRLLGGGADTDTFAKAVHIISEIDTNVANAVLFESGSGRLIVMSTPLAFSNYALLQDQNYHYLEDVMSYVDQEVSSVHLSIGSTREPDHSNMAEIWKHKATRTAILLAILGILLYVLLNLRRRQNIIPVIKPLTNDSRSFVETIAGLYYNKRNNQNIAQKMIQHFLEQVRTQFKLNTIQLDNEFRDKLSLRSGVSIGETAALVHQIRSILQETVIVDDKYLYSLHVNIKKFKKNQPN